MALSKPFQDKKACINIKNFDDNKCFLYSILAIRFSKNFPKNQRNLPQTYTNLLDYFNTDGIKFPVTVKDIKLFERINAHREVSINVFGVEGQQIVGPLYSTHEEKRNHCNLLLLENKYKLHYVAIISMSRLLSSRISSHTSEKYFCFSCLSHFNRGEDLEFHKEIGCGKIRTIMPTSKPFLEFTNLKAKQRHAVVFYGDLECILEKYHRNEPNPNKSYTTAIQRHTPCSFAYSIQLDVYDKEFEKLRIHRSKDCLDVFVDTLVKDVKLIYNRYLKDIHPMETITTEIKQKLDSQTQCYLCRKDFSEDDTTAIDHCHVTGKIRAKTHAQCNILCQTPKFIPFLFHCGSSYDFHLLIMAFAKKKVGKMSCLPKTKENYISFTVSIEMDQYNSIDIRFLDSYRFLPASISTLTETVRICPEYIKFHEKSFPHANFWTEPGKQFFPYDYFDSFDRFQETVFPSIDKFFSPLTNKTITSEDYAHALDVFNHLEDKTLGGYIDYYLTTDTLLLRDIFEYFRTTSIKDFLLDPVFFYTSAGFSFDACLDYIQEKIYLITDQNMLSLIKNNIRGGISCAMTRFSESNNEYLKTGYDETKGPPTQNMYIDCNGLYTYTMIHYPLPISDFEFLEGDEFLEIEKSFLDIPQDSEYGYIILADIEYPPELHDLHNDLPFCVESLKIGKVKKLVPNLFHKQNYCCHYLLLKQAVRFGLRLKKIHKIIKFKQGYWLRSYIDLCARLRQNPLNTEFQKQMYKNLANLIFGKFIQSIELYRNVMLITDWISKGKKLDARRLLKSPRFKSFAIFSEDLIALELQRTKITYDRPSAVGFSILELSKVHMYEFIYGTLQAKLGPENLRIGYIDTDGIIITVTNVDFYQFMKKFQNHFDTSDYSVENQFQIIPQNRKVPGLFHDEGKGQPVTRFIALRPKSYAIEFEGGTIIKKLKSVSKTVTKSLSFQDYAKVWKNRDVFYAKMFRIYSKDHVLETVEINKKAMSGDDDKRYILNDNIHTLALGHKNCK